MHKISKIIYLQGTFLFAILIIIGLVISNSTITGNSILISDQTDEFAPPFDIFTTDNIISLEHQQVDNTTFHITAEISMSNSYLYHNLYYYTYNGWEKISISSNTWIKNSATANIEDFYANIPLQEGDDFYLGVWICKNINNSWGCGCKTPSDCGHWHIQSIELEEEGETIIPCEDKDGDGYGIAGEEQCFFNITDCDDTNAAISPGEIEIIYNTLDDDCNASTVDDDLDLDGATIITDCNDTNAAINPFATEICNDFIDQDCNGQDSNCEQCGEGAVITTGCNCADESKYMGFCCDNTYQLVPCGTPEVIFYDGFESGTGNTWEYLNPYSRVNRDLPYSGILSLNFIYASGKLQSNQYAETSLVPYNHSYHKYHIYFEEDYLHETNGVTLGIFGSKSWPIKQLVRKWQGDTGQGKLYLSIDGNELATNTIFSNGQWYCVEEEIISNNGNDEIRLWIDGNIILEEIGLDFSYGEKINYLQQGGQYENSISDTMHIYIDDVIVSRERVGCN